MSNSDQQFEQWLHNFEQNGGYLLEALCLVFLFCGLAVICDDYFIPCLDGIRKKFRIPGNVAGATFMALGSSSPELSTNILATIHGDAGLLELGLGTIIGSGVFEFTIVIGIACMFCASPVPLSPQVIFRDMIFYALSISMLYIFFWDKQIEIYEAGMLVMLWVIYIIIVVRYGKKQSTSKLNRKSFLFDFGQETKGSLLQNESRHDSEEEESDKEEDDELATELTDLMNHQHTSNRHISCYTRMGRGIKKVVLFPWTTLFRYTIPLGWHSREKYAELPSVFVLLSSFAMCVVYVGLSSQCIMSIIRRFVVLLGASHALLGMTLVSWGDNIPDIVNVSVAVRKGWGDMAVSSAVGSQIVNILVCLGLPWLIAALSGRTILIHSDGAIHAILLLGAVSLFFLISVMLAGMSLSRCVGLSLFCSYACFLAYEFLYVSHLPSPGPA
eukprot:GILK01011686.1.p1 GENE.GILK01011686.1~~GILK01011686.1.p1  ORF type:complete len:443 (+),score=38.81 GILK01011686.1:144-1472(+)